MEAGQHCTRAEWQPNLNQVWVIVLSLREDFLDHFDHTLEFLEVQTGQFGLFKTAMPETAYFYG